MIPLDRTKGVVEPFRLALMTARQGEVSWHPYSRPTLSGLHGIGLRGLSGLAGLWDDILALGEQAGQNWLDRQLAEQGITTDVIAIQNAVGAAMDQLSAQYYPLRDSGQVTQAIITRFQQAMQTLINSFCAKMRTIPAPLNARALAGCETIKYWGGRWIADLEVEKAALAGGQPVSGGCTVTDPVTGQCISFTNPPSGIPSSVTSYMPLVLGAAFLFVMFKSSKKW